MQEALEGLLFGLQVAITAENLLAAFAGALAGTVLGIIPGIGPVAGAAIVLPLTFTMEPTAALIVISAIYYGVAYGSSTSAILLNIPGEVSSVVTAIDGYKMTEKGHGGRALGVAAVASFFAAVPSVLLVALAGPFFADVGLRFGPAEFFSVTLGGLIVLAISFTGGRPSNGLVPLFLGLALGTVGTEAVTGTQRFTFGSLTLSEGVSVVSLGIGVWAITELLFIVGSKNVFSKPSVRPLRFRDCIPTRQDLTRSVSPIGRGGAVGFGFGVLPGPAQALSSFFAYRLEKAVGRNRKELGTGAVEGVAGPEAANNAAATSAVIPILALGLPFSATLAFMITALQVQGVTPGPLLMTQRPEIFWGVIASMLIGNVVLVVLNINLISVWVRVLRIRYDILIPAIFAMSVAGAFGARYILADIFWIIPLAVVGYFLRRAGMGLVPLLLGLILGPLVEKHLREGLFLSAGDWTYLFTSSGITIAIWTLVVLSLLLPPILNWVRERRGAKAPLVPVVNDGD
ncbi:MAG: tripartite tricarboxylate transporter permease [Actinomycetota bacterium]|nr:tripartite tricarboxylate transporter permease [Actinomycetota bacterium]